MSFDLTSFAKSLGWNLAGVSDLDLPEETKQRYAQWIQHYKGDQMAYLERRMEERFNPKLYFSKARSILCFGLFYFPGWAKGSVKVSNYSWGDDYHLTLKSKLEDTVDRLRAFFPDIQTRVCVDTSPVLEKFWAQQAGLGWQGKNTLLLNRKWGSTFFLGEILTSLDPDQFQRASLADNHCGTCTRCIDACPTDALSPYVLDAKRCISYWTLEHKGSFTEETPQYREWVAGCDVCQEVCPWNQKLLPVETEDLDLSFQDLKEADLASPDWERALEGKAVDYVKKENWPRNLEWVKGSASKPPFDQSDLDL